ncbi:TlpA disulfide reductase family protein [Belliella marina]|uniref:TlpA disulfide reductase family protein n=1 Tax=Belliella marina TaxID=1644146 RepID=A0ABW4VPX3_9BACT
MKDIKSVLSALFLAALASCHPGKEQIPENTFLIEGSVAGLDSAEVKIVSNDMIERSSTTLDSTMIVNGKFTLKGDMDSPRDLNMLIVTDGMTYYANVKADKSIMEITLDTAKYDRKSGSFILLTPKVKGSKFHEDYESYEALIEPFKKDLYKLSSTYDELGEKYRTAKKLENSEEEELYKEEMEQVKLEMEPFREKIDSVTNHFIENDLGNQVSAFLMSTKISSYKLDRSVDLFGRMPEDVKGGFYGKSIEKQLEKLKKASPGAEASLFETTDINGEELRLIDFRGQYVLLDFWASWCVPCRKGNPHLIQLHQKYHDKGFEIIGISDDDSNHDAWKKAIEVDKIGIWKHALRGLKIDRTEGFKILEDAISEGYDIHFLPTKILIDPQGIIIGRFGSEEEELDKLLEEIFEA